MAKLKIQGFLSFKNAEILTNDLTVLIGPQAQGKSVIAKLVHYFETLVRRCFVEVISGDTTIPALRKQFVERFTDLFPRHSWSAEPFEITYSQDGWTFQITRDGIRSNASIRLDLSGPFESLLKADAKSFKTQLKKSLTQKGGYSQGTMSRRLMRSFFADREQIHPYLAEQVFIPASRSFFANIEKNIFSLISSKFDIDPLIAEFGATLEQMRIRNHISARTLNSRQSTKRSPDTLVKDWKEIINGDYLFNGKDEFIVTHGRTVRLSNSSSGQQEVLPLLLALGAQTTRFSNLQFGGTSFFIEEPEAHLFPYAQKSIAELLAKKLNEMDLDGTGTTLKTCNRVLVTTHSPYILTALNNLMLAGQLYNSTTVASNAIEKITPREISINPKKVSAYKVIDGNAKSILNSETELIDSYLIDEISEVFAKDFDKLLELQMKGSAQKSTRIGA